MATQRRRHHHAVALLLLVCASVCAGAATVNEELPAGEKRNDQQFSLLLIVGDVTPTGARILYDHLRGDDDDSSSLALRVRVFVSTDAAPGIHMTPLEPVAYKLQQERTIERFEHKAPRVLQLLDLTPNRLYRVGFQLVSGTNHSGDEELVKFRTQSLPDSQEPRATDDRVLIVSCDRYVDDLDDTLWLQIVDDIETHPASYFGMAHIGDQVYVDAGGASIPIVPVSVEMMMSGNEQREQQLRERYTSVVDQFRSIYRRTFGRPVVQRALRSGAHWMIPDDHEVINNFNFERVQRVLVVQPDDDDDKLASWSPEDRLNQEYLWGLALHCRAGLQVYYEYQFQLQRDFPFEHVDFLFEPLAEVVERFPVYFAVEVNDLKLFFMDLRFDRSFFASSGDGGELHSQLVGEAQMNSLEQSLERWSLDPMSAAVVLSAVPLFFHSTLSAGVTYVVEKETYPGMKAQLSGLQALFEVFVSHSQLGNKDDPSNSAPMKLLVGGDVHFLAHSQVCGSYGEEEMKKRGCVDQLITSGVTRGSTAISDLKLVPFYFLVTRLTPFINSIMTWTGLRLPGISPHWSIEYEKLFLGRNYG
ncbi:hypothetical protein Gpo141_00008585 [Globisporangium polare]